jgi:hypothetical protein
MEMNGTTVIGRPIETVFAYVNDVSNDVHWRTGITGSGLRQINLLALDRLDTPVLETRSSSGEWSRTLLVRV